MRRLTLSGSAAIVTRVSSRVIALLLVVALLPATRELVETVIYAVSHGDVAHADGLTDDASTPSEEGCTGVVHVCSCHTTVPASPPAPRLVIDMHPSVRYLATVRPRTWSGEGAPAPWIRPPIV